MKELLKALSEAKKEIGAISKDSKNPFFKSKYFDINQLLAHVEPILETKGLLILQPIIDNKVCTQIYHVESEKMISSVIELPNLLDPQKLGSSITYYRRYTLGSLLSLQAQDDDANDFKFGHDDKLPWVSDDNVKAMLFAIPTNRDSVIDSLIKYKWSKANKKIITDALSK